MKNKELRNLWKLAKRVWIYATIFWIFETTVFLIVEGWHIKPTNKYEILCDKLVGNMWNFALWLTITICGNYLINLTFKSKK
jgi:hypothetical protein